MLYTIQNLRLACIESVSVGLGSKETPRNPLDPTETLATLVCVTDETKPRGLVSSVTQAIATQAT